MQRPAPKFCACRPPRLGLQPSVRARCSPATLCCSAPTAGTFFAMDRETGVEVWKFATGAPNLPSSPVVVGDLVVFGAFDGHVYGLDTATGAMRWQYSGAEKVLSSPAVADGVVYVGSRGDEPAVHAIDGRTGEPIWRLPVDEFVGASPVVDDELVYIYTESTVYAIER